MTTKYPTPSRRNKFVSGPYVSWFLNGRWVKFRILPDHTDLPEDADLIGHAIHAIHEDHLEELYQYGDQFFRYAGGGRGFYWTQELQIEEDAGKNVG